MLVVVLLVTSYLVYRVYRHLTRRSTEPPTLVDSLPLIGHAHYLMFGTVDKLYDKLVHVSYGSLKDGGVTSTTFGPFNVYTLSDPDAATTVLESCLEKDLLYDFWEPWMGHGLLTGPYSVAKPHRKMMLPAFNQRALDEFIPKLNNQSRQLANRISGHLGQGPFDILPYLALNGLELILLTACGQSECDKILLNEYLETVQEIHRLTCERLIHVWYHVDFIFNFSGLKKIQDEKVKVLHKLSNEVIEKRRAIIKDSDKNEEDETSGFNNKNKIVVDLLLEFNDKGVITHEEMRDEISTVIFGGHDTSAGTLLFTIILLGSYPEIQERVFTELQNVCGTTDDVLKQDFSKLMYLEAVIKESMRLYPFLPFLARRIDKDIKTKNHILSAGGRCLMLVYGIHRHSMWGEDAEVFRPERWLEPNGVPASPAAFAGFSFGKRGCIGKTYAMMSMKTILAHLLRQFRFRADHTQLQIKFEVVLKPKSGQLVTIERRI